jgi:hypothetical protein
LLAKPSCPAAEHLLAVLYGKGHGVRQDLVRAYAPLLVAASYAVEPMGETAPVSNLGNDEDKSEIVQFAQTPRSGSIRWGNGPVPRE